MNAVITGATKGMGRAIAQKFAAEGYSVIACARTKKDLEQMKEEFLVHFPSVTCSIFVADIAVAEQVKKFGQWIIDSGEIVDILVNNAGYYAAGSLYGEEEETLAKMLDINLFSAYHLTRAMLPAMMERKQGHIFNICSVASFTPEANVGSYGISKFALYGLTKILREEMKPHNIKVTAVSPGATYTASWENEEVDSKQLMESQDVAKMIFAASQLSPAAVVEDIIMRPQKG